MYRTPAHLCLCVLVHIHIHIHICIHIRIHIQIHLHIHKQCEDMGGCIQRQRICVYARERDGRGARGGVGIWKERDQIIGFPQPQNTVDRGRYKALLRNLFSILHVSVWVYGCMGVWVCVCVCVCVSLVTD